jgi:outer membrane protein assembly factor BamB
MYASPMVMEFDGVRQVVVVNQGFLVGHDLADGRVLWKHEWPGSNHAEGSNSQPHQVAADQLFISKGYGEGGRLIRVFRREPGEWDTKAIWPGEDWSGRRVMKTKLTNVAIRHGFVYGLDDGILQCIEFETGEQRWKSGRYEHGQILLVEDLLLIRPETSGELVLVEASPEGHRELARFQVLDRRRSWNHLCLAGKYLLVRNDAQAACVELPTE